MSNKSELRRLRKDYHEFTASVQHQRKQRDKQRAMNKRHARRVQHG